VGYAISKSDDVDKQRLLYGLRHVLLTPIYSHIQMKLVDKNIAFQNGISFQEMDKSIKRRYKLDEIVKNEFIGDLIVIQAYMKL